MKLNKLLERQLNKFLPADCRDKQELAAFINAVNDSYNAFDRDLELSERAFRISEEEYRDLNTRLSDEMAEKEASIAALRDTLNPLQNTVHEDSLSSDILQMATSLQKHISEMSESEQKLMRQKMFYERILNEIPADIAILDKNKTYLFVNPNAIKNPDIRQWIIGKTDDEYAAYRGRPVTATDMRAQAFAEAVSSKKKLEQEERIVTKDGSVEYHLRVLSPVFDERGELDIMIIYGVNITERKKIEEQIKRSEARFKSIFNNSLALICTHDLHGIIIDVNTASSDILGYTEAELIGAPLFKILPRERQAEFQSVYMGELLKNGKASGIMLANNKAGDRIYLLYQNYLVTDQGTEPYVIGFAQDVTQRMTMEKALKKSEEKYRNIIANMNLGLMEVDNFETIVYANNSFCEMSGYDLDEVIGKNPIQMFLKGENQEHGENVIERRKNGLSDAYEIKVKDKRGNLKWWLVSGAPSYDNTGALKGTIGIHLDITHQKMLEEELRQAKSDAEHSAHAKEIFLANMSHEIRTPMNAILGISGLLSKSSLQPQQRAFLNNIQTASNNLLVIINDLLDFSKIESGKLTLERIGFHLNVVIDNAVQILRHRAEEKGILLQYDRDISVAPVLLGDPYRINQILMNLLSNSIKFTENGKVTISCKVLHNSTQRQEIRFTVSDTGIGMSADFITHLFDKFSQEDESITRRYGGTGLGMSIIKQLVELMGGTIHVSSEKNKGTTISFNLRFDCGKDTDIPQTRYGNTDTQILKGKHILLVEDNELNRVLATAILTDYGAEVTEAENGSIAIDLMLKDSFDLVLMDVQMPVKDGIEATRYIRSYINSSVPIIALTANAQKQQEEQCLNAGMNDFISKPFTETRLVQLTGKWLGRDASATLNISSEKEDETDTAPVNLSKLHDIARGEDAFVTKMTELFLEKTPPLLEQLEKADNNGDLEAVAFLAHRIKTSVGIMGIPNLEQCLEELDNMKDVPISKELISTYVKRIISNVQRAITHLRTL